MQTTALNLMAIAVFIMTLSVLLGPILNISPAIPALTTFAVMGLITIDTLGWQNRGMTMLLGALASSEQKQRIVHHEAGHFLAAYFLGIPVSSYTLSAWEAWRDGQSGMGGVVIDQEVWNGAVGSQTMPIVVERLTTVLMAGIAAERVVYGNATGGAEDQQKLGELLRTVGLSTDNYQRKARWGQVQAQNLIDNHTSAYQALVKAMQNRQSVTQCYQILHQQVGNSTEE